MKRILLFILLFAALTCTEARVRIPPQPAVAASSYLFEDNFETGSAPSGYTIVGVWSWNTTSPVLQGTYCAKAGGSYSDITLTKAFTAQGEIWVHFLLYDASSTNQIMVKFYDAGEVSVMTFTLYSNGKGNVVEAINYWSSDTVGARSANTVTHFWLHYKKGTSNNAVGDIGFSSTGTRPTSGDNFATIGAHGGATTDVTHIKFTMNAGNVVEYLDRFLISTSQIGDNP